MEKTGKTKDSNFRFGENSGLDCTNRTMSFVSYFLLDVIAFFMIVVTVIMVVVYILIRRVIRLLAKKKRD